MYSSTMPEIDRRSLLYAFGIASLPPCYQRRRLLDALQLPSQARATTSSHILS